MEKKIYVTVIESTSSRLNTYVWDPDSAEANSQSNEERAVSATGVGSLLNTTLNPPPLVLSALRRVDRTGDGFWFRRHVGVGIRGNSRSQQVLPHPGC